MLAAGDIAEQQHPCSRVRVEHWANALHQAARYEPRAFRPSTTVFRTFSTSTMSLEPALATSVGSAFAAIRDGAIAFYLYGDRLVRRSAAVNVLDVNPHVRGAHS